MKKDIQSYRLEKNLTQAELAEKAGLSLRTIQRIEAGVIPKRYTLKSIAGVLGIDPEIITKNKEEDVDFSRVKMINLSALCFIIIPFGNIILPSILTYKSKDERIKLFGKNIISIQIIWTLITSVLMIISPFIQKLISSKIPMLIIVLVFLMSLNIIVILINGVYLTKKSDLLIKLKFNIL